MAVIVRTHGGLGNQLFQVLFARLEAGSRGVPYGELHDLNYAHRFARSSMVPVSGYVCTPLQRALSRLRLPKLLKRTGLFHGERIAIGRDVYLDGYFQEVRDYAPFSDVAVAGEIQRLREELGIDAQPNPDSRILCHVRLGDFFESAESAEEHALARVAELQPGSTILTNQEELFANGRIRALMEEKRCRIHPSMDYAPEDVLRLMASYGIIATNNSTLALWASVLGNCQTTFSDRRLAALHTRLFDAANGVRSAG